MLKQGEILKKFISSLGIRQEDFALSLGYKQRQGLTYHFKSYILDNELIRKLQEINKYDEFLAYAKNMVIIYLLKQIR